MSRISTSCGRAISIATAKGSRRSDRDKLIRFPKRSGMLSSLGSVVLVLIPAYLVYRVWQQYVYTKSLETRLNERN
jgi:hypothetical protein